MQKTQRIKTLSQLRQQKRILQKRMRFRQKVLEYRIKRFESQLTVPNITRELFRDSRLELIAPIVAASLSQRFASGKDLLSALGGFFAGFGSLFSWIKRSKKAASVQQPVHAQPPKEKSANNNYHDEQMFI